MSATMNHETRDLIRGWQVRGTKEGDQFVRFFVFYMCLDAWVSTESLEEYDSGKLDWLINKDPYLKKCWETIFKEPEVQRALNTFLFKGYVENMHPNHRGKNEGAHLDNIEDFDQVVRFIYQIRCNLFHGGKSPDDPNDTTLVDAGSVLLKRWLEEAFKTLN